MNITTRFSSVSIIIALAVFSVGAFFVSVPLAHAVGVPLIDEVSAPEASGWVEIFNTSGSNVSLDGYSVVDVIYNGAGDPVGVSTTTIGAVTLPADGIVVISDANHGVDGGRVTLYDASLVALNTVSWGTAPGASFASPAAGQSAAVDVTFTTWTVGTPTKGWFNDGFGAPSVATIVSGMTGVTTNWGTVDVPDSSATPSGSGGLYFDKTGQGRVTFTASLNLTDADTATFLQSLGSYMDASAGAMKFDATTASQLRNAGAQIQMFGLDALGITTTPGLIVRNDSGTIIDGSTVVSGTSYDAGTGTLTFDASHFTRFQIDTVYVNDATGNDANDGTAASPVKTIQHAIDIVPEGGTVRVLPGTYNEFLSVTTNNVKIESTAGTSTTVIDVQGHTNEGVGIHADSVTLDGFTVQGASTNPAYEMRMVHVEGSNNTVKNNTIVGDLAVWNDDGVQYGVYVRGPGGPAASGNTIQNNEVRNINYIGIEIYGQTGNLTGSNTISGNYVHDIGFYGIAIDRSPSNSITQNTISDLLGMTGYDPATWTAGIIIWGELSDGNSITDQTVSGLPNVGVSLSSAHNTTLDGVTVTDNAGTGIKISKSSWAGGIPTGNVIKNSTIQNNATGVQITGGAGDIGTGNAVSDNNTISGNTSAGVDNTSGVSTDATVDWWGDASGPSGSGPGTGDSVSADVLFSPWWKDAGRTSLDSTITTSGGQASTTISSDMTMTGTSTGNGSVTVTAEIPSGTVITGDDTWDGTIEPPTTTTQTVTVSGFSTTVLSAITIGSSDTDLTFDNAVKLTFAGQAGQHVGWYNHAGTFTEITTTCVDNTQVTNNLLPAGGSCKIDSGSDLVVWTKHFSAFVTYSQLALSSGGGGGSTNYPSSSGSAAAPATPATPTAAAATPATPATPAPQGQVLGAATYNFTVNLTIGSRGTDVIELQKYLLSEGFAIPLLSSGAASYGYFGSQTRAALAAYQRAHNIAPAVGFFGPLTRAAFKAGATPAMTDAERSLRLQNLNEQLLALLVRVKAMLGQ